LEALGYVAIAPEFRKKPQQFAQNARLFAAFFSGTFYGFYLCENFFHNFIVAIIER